MHQTVLQSYAAAWAYYQTPGPMPMGRMTTWLIALVWIVIRGMFSVYNIHTGAPENGFGLSFLFFALFLDIWHCFVNSRPSRRVGQVFLFGTDSDWTWVFEHFYCIYTGTLFCQCIRIILSFAFYTTDQGLSCLSFSEKLEVPKNHLYLKRALNAFW